MSKSCRKTISNKEAQAMIEFLFMVPLLVTMMILIYQSYVMIHKVQVAQKYLKLGVVANLANQHAYDFDALSKEATPVSKFFFNYTETTDKRMSFDFDTVTRSLILSFASSEQENNMKEVFSSFAGRQQLGVCLDTNLSGEITTNIFEDWNACY